MSGLVSELVKLYLLLAFEKDSLTVNQIDQLKERISHVTSLKVEQIYYMFSQPDDANPINTLVAFYLQDNKDKSVTGILQLSALKKHAWLTENNVLSLRVNDDSSINIREDSLGIQSVKCTKEKPILGKNVL